MLKKILLGLVAIIAVFVVVGFVLPGTMSVERSIVVAAAPDAVFPIIADFEYRSQWDPWANEDPTVKNTDTGGKGVGARREWTGDKSGTGVMEIVAYEAPTSVTSKLAFDGGEFDAKSGFTLSPVEGGTKIVWTFHWDIGGNPILRYMGLVMKDMVAENYETGLSNIKSVIEKTPAE